LAATLSGCKAGAGMQQRIPEGCTGRNKVFEMLKFI